MISVDLVVYGRDESPTKLAIVANKILPSCLSSRFEMLKKRVHVVIFELRLASGQNE